MFSLNERSILLPKWEENIVCNTEQDRVNPYTLKKCQISYEVDKTRSEIGS